MISRLLLLMDSSIPSRQYSTACCESRVWGARCGCAPVGTLPDTLRHNVQVHLLMTLGLPPIWGPCRQIGNGGTAARSSPSCK